MVEPPGTDPHPEDTQPVVVDGLMLGERWRRHRDGTTDTGLATVLNAVTDPDTRAAVVATLTALDDALDATADALLAEDVHHAAQGDPGRLSATLAAVGGPLPELEFPWTPRTGVSLTHRLLLGRVCWILTVRHGRSSPCMIGMT